VSGFVRIFSEFCVFDGGWLGVLCDPKRMHQALDTVPM
jgi:hypothetical protein